MSLACRQLTNTRDNVDRITESVSYESQAAFSRAFKKQVGISPATWRASHG